MHFNKQNITELKGKTITFYSYKGGVGRSMALVNVACLMAKQKKKVLLIDWDLEAPGLHSFFKNADDKDYSGLVDLIGDVIEYSKSEDKNDEIGYADFLTANLNKYVQRDIRIDDSEYHLDLIKSGKFNDEYTTKLNAIDWMGFYKNAPAFFRTFAQYLESNYDYILIDSRTGLSDTGGICTMLMPQVLVLVFVLNSQNINGVVDVARQCVNYRFSSNDHRELTVLPLPSRIDNQNPAELEVWMKLYTERFSDLFKEIYMLDECPLENYFNIAKIPYKPIHAYGEKIPVLTENTNNDLFISYHYNQFYKQLMDDSPIWEILTSEEIEQNRKQANSHFHTGLKYFYDGKYELACTEFEKSCNLDKNSSSALINWGGSLAELANTKGGIDAEELHYLAIEKYQKAIELGTNRQEAYNNWGNSLGALAKIKEGKDVVELYYLAIEKYQRAVEIKPDYPEAFNNWGNTLGDLAKFKEGKAANELYYLAIEKYQRAVEIRPDLHQALNSWGDCLVALARTKEGKEAEELYNLAFEKYQRAIELRGKCYNLACLYAVKGNMKDAFYYLNLSLKKKEIMVAFVQEDEDWKNYLQDKEFIEILSRYRE